MGGSVNGPCVADVERALARAFPLERAEAWDRVGLLVGDPRALVTGVALALDPTVAAVREAVAHGANVLVTHHPAFLEPPRAIVPGATNGGDVAYEAAVSGVALIAAHTNLDRDPRAQAMLPESLRLEVVGPLETEPEPCALIAVFSPPEHGDRVRRAMAEAGAGGIGAYEECSFTALGTGRFTPGDEADPVVGERGRESAVDEERIEMVCPRAARDRVMAAAIQAHPYEEPLVIANEVSRSRNRAGLGALASPARGEGTTVGQLAERALAAFGVPPRVWGDEERRVARIATATGSASGLIPAAVAAGAEVLVAGELRYHDALHAVASGLALIELGHDVSERPLVGLLEEVVARALPDVPRVRVPERPWWTPTIGKGTRDASHPW